jgi:small subunit ribosomal protein S2
VAKELARNLINAGVHFGHGVSRWNPKMKPYIFAKRGMIHIIDVKETLKGLLIAKKLLTKVVSSNKDVVFVGTKRQARKSAVQAAAETDMHYVIERWLGGTLTNFRTIRSRLQRLEELEAMQESGALDAESKKQASRLKRELRKIKTNLEGIRNMSRLPGAVVVVDARREHLALREARKLGIPSIGIIDTDSDPDEVDIAIPANDDSLKAIDIIFSEFQDAIKEGKQMAAVATEATAAPVSGGRPRSRRVLAAADGSESVGGDQENADNTPEPAQSSEQQQQESSESEDKENASVAAGENGQGQQ